MRGGKWRPGKILITPRGRPFFTKSPCRRKIFGQFLVLNYPPDKKFLDHPPPLAPAPGGKFLPPHPRGSAPPCVHDLAHVWQSLFISFILFWISSKTKQIEHGKFWASKFEQNFFRAISSSSLFRARFFVSNFEFQFCRAAQFSSEPSKISSERPLSLSTSHRVIIFMGFHGSGRVKNYPNTRGSRVIRVIWSI